MKKALKKAPRQTNTGTRSKQQLRKYQFEKCQAIMAYTDSGFKNSRPSMTDYPAIE